MADKTILNRALKALLGLALSASASTGNAAQAFHLLKHHDDGQPAKVVMHTASKTKVVAHANAFEKRDWNPFSKRNRYLKRMEKATKAGGFSNINVPFQNSMWTTKLPTPARVKKLAMPIHLPHREGARAHMVAVRPKRHWRIW